MEILVFLVRKYLYNASRIEPWDDGKPKVSVDDIRHSQDGGDYLNQWFGLLNEVKSAYKNKKRNTPSMLI